MATTSLTKVGNSMAVLLPKALRQEAGIESDTRLSLSSPRKGVVVITALQDSTEERLKTLERAEKRIAENAKNMNPWPEGLTADDLIKQGKEARLHEFLSL